ncbi:MAG: hypothetical protein RLZZ576_748 [Actinomycetota bacterium]|jgi:guanylate kinase
MANSLTVIAGPTAVGKGTVVRYIIEHFHDVHLSISATTRAPRPGEQHGREYFFVSQEEFDRMISDGELLEWATVHGKHSYGTPRKPIESALASGKQVILEIDLQGAKQVKKMMPDANLVFIAPPSWDELINRLKGRGTESEAEMTVRLETAKAELAQQDLFDHIVINDEVATCAQNIVQLMQ